MEYKENNNGTLQRKHAPLELLNPGLFVLLVIIVIFITYQIFGGITSLLILGTDLKSNTNISLSRIIISASQFLFILVPVFILHFLRGGNFQKTFRANSPKLSLLFLSILGIFVIQPSIQAYMFLQTKALNHFPFGSNIINQLKELMDTLESYTMNIVTAHTAVEFLVVIFVIAVTPAICEEFLFRGLILSDLEKSSKPATAIFLTGFIFAIFHFHPFNIIPLILLGYYLGFIVHYTNSLSTGIIIHFLNNFISAFFAYKFGKENLNNAHESIKDNRMLIFAGVVSLIIFFALLKSIKNISEKENKKIIVNV